MNVKHDIRRPVRQRCALPCALAVLAMGAASMAAHATTSLTINVTGQIKLGTCDFTIANVDLGTFPLATFSGPGTTTAWVPTQVTQSNCDPAITTVHMQFTGAADATNPAYFSAVSADGLAGVAIELGDANQASVAPNGTADWNITGGAISYTLNARFVQTMASVSSGQANTPITVQFTYN